MRDIKRAEELLRAKGVNLSIGGCGCCGSPSVYLAIDGELLIGNVDRFHEEDNVQLDTERGDAN